MKANVIGAIFRRNFFSYFANPTGYVFICVFVLLSSFAAFWPHEFFNANLANLDQLNRYLPYIMLMFIPAITMSIWADERRQGTDELLLTIPAGDFDVVLGKYLAAVAIYSVSLLFSLVCNFLVLTTLGSPDMGLFLGTYVGYWMVGLAMLSVGMVASFLTGNLTVGFVLGALFNAPLAFAAKADVIMPADLALKVKSWSLEDQFRDFGRGVISLSGAGYFILIVVVMLYLSMVLIGRRHWLGGRDGSSLVGHFIVRTLALAAMAAGGIYVFDRLHVRADMTTEKLSSLSSDTRELIAKLDPKHPVRIDAYISPEVPESYVQTRLDLLSMLREFEALGGDKVRVRFHETRPLTREAEQAEKQFGITGREVFSRSRGAIRREKLYLGVAFTSGLDKVVVPFVDRGIPVEYEFVRSICTVSQQSRKKIGVLATDARLFGGFNPQTGVSRNELLIEELEKQYEVVQVNADGPITADFDALLAVQPSTLSPEQMDHFVSVVRGGTPTAIFEDPFPFLAGDVTATSAPRRPPQQMSMFMMPNQPPLPKGEIVQLWKLLGIDFSDSKVVWQDYNPHPHFRDVSEREWVWVNAGASDEGVFNEEQPISANLQQMLFLFPGSMSRLNASDLKFEPLVLTGDKTGTVAYDEILEPSFFGHGGGFNRQRRQIPTRERYTLAARIHGKLAAENLPMSDAKPEPAEDEGQSQLDPSGDQPAAGGEAPGEVDADQGNSDDSAEKNRKSQKDKDKPGKKPAQDPRINVVLVADIDILYSAFFQLRSQGDDPEGHFQLNLDNVTFVLNVLDTLADDGRFVEVRKRRPKHRILQRIEGLTERARLEAMDKKQSFQQEFEATKAQEQKEFDAEIAKLKKAAESGLLSASQRFNEAQRVGERRLQVKIQQLEQKRDRATDKIERDLAFEINRVQDGYKMRAVLLPPIPPLLVGLAVYFSRRAREREGVSRARLR